LGGSTEKLAKTVVTIGLVFSCVMLLVLFHYNIKEMNESRIPLLSNKGIQRLLSSFIESFMMIVFSVPEGLPLVMTLSLSHTVQILRVFFLS
jgi:P-type Ca2+ transporter type 2B